MLQLFTCKTVQVEINTSRIPTILLDIEGEKPSMHEVKSHYASIFTYRIPVKGEVIWINSRYIVDSVVWHAINNTVTIYLKIN